MPVPTSQPEFLRPGEVPRDQLNQRLGGAKGLFSNENLDLLSRVLDTWFRIPGTDIRFGLDGIIGFIPGIGDFVAGAASCLIILAAFVRGVPMVTLARMVANLAIEVGVGMIPVLGNLFDIGWRANRRNYHLLERSIAAPHRDTWKDWMFVGVLGAGLLMLVLLPAIVVVWLFGALLHATGAPGWR